MNRLIIVAVALLTACGGAGKKNVAACEDWVASLSECGTVADAFTGDGFCDGYSETTCDISEYFNCQADYYTAICAGDPPPAEACTIPVCD